MPYQSKYPLIQIILMMKFQNYISPIKMFEYLATGIPIISSDLKVIKKFYVNQKFLCFKKLLKYIFLEKSNK